MTPDTEFRSGKVGATAFGVGGKGEAIVLAHGVGMTREIWTPQAARLARSFKVVTYDLLGHGDSDLPAEQATLQTYADQLRTLLGHLGIAAANVVGHSMGALVALEFALAHPARTLRVAALNAVFQRTPEQRAAVESRAADLKAGSPTETVGPTLQRWFGNPVPPELHDAAALTERLLRAANPVGYARTYQLFARSDRVHTERLPGLAVPALFLTGEDDSNSSPSMSMAMARLVPNARVQVIPGARHMMNVTHPQQVTEALLEFLKDGRG